jgi:hypothetical protein
MVRHQHVRRPPRNRRGHAAHCPVLRQRRRTEMRAHARGAAVRSLVEPRRLRNPVGHAFRSARGDSRVGCFGFGGCLSLPLPRLGEGVWALWFGAHAGRLACLVVPLDPWICLAWGICPASISRCHFAPCRGTSPGATARGDTRYKSLLAIHTQGGKDNSLKQQPQAVVPSLAGII